MIIWPVSKGGVMGAEGPQRRDVATPDGSSQEEKNPHSVLFRLKGGKEAAAEAGGRVAEENRTSQGVSLLDKQGLGFRGHQPLLRSSLSSKAGNGAPWPGEALPPWLQAALIMGSIRGIFYCIRAPMISLNDSDGLRQ